MKRLHIFILIFSLLLLVALPACKRGEEVRGDVIPARATYTFAELRGFEVRGEADGVDATTLAARFSEDYVVFVATENGTQAVRDFVECTDGAMTLVHHVGKGTPKTEDGKTVFTAYESERHVLGTYDGREMTLTRPLFEDGYVKDAALILRILEPNGAAAFAYELVFTSDQ